MNEKENVFAGIMLGTVVGDALGLPAENLSPEKIRKRWKGEWRMRLVFGKGMVSDDTEHALMTAQALLQESRDAQAFQRGLAWKLRWWFAGLPGGVGLATARACIKLWLGFPPDNAGVRSAGSGPVMRSAIIGAYFANDTEARKKFVMASTRLTHRSWQADAAALAVANAAALILCGESEAGKVLKMLRGISTEVEWQKIITTMESSLSSGETVAEFAPKLGLQRGVTGYALHVVPVAIYAWLRHPRDFRLAMVSALDCGGDTDTVGAIVGALAGAEVAKAGIPAEWMNGICEWPRSIGFMERVADRLAKGGEGQVSYFWPGVLPRNLIFLVIVLAHGFRRLLPPY